MPRGYAIAPNSGLDSGRRHGEILRGNGRPASPHGLPGSRKIYSAGHCVQVRIRKSVSVPRADGIQIMKAFFRIFSVAFFQNPVIVRSPVYHFFHHFFHRFAILFCSVSRATVNNIGSTYSPQKNSKGAFSGRSSLKNQRLCRFTYLRIRLFCLLLCFIDLLYARNYRKTCFKCQ